MKQLTAIDMTGNPVINAADAGTATGLVTLQQMQAAMRGLDWKDSVRAASTANVASLSGPQTIDGVSLVAGNDVLLKNQTAASANGIYTVAAGAWTRRIDADANAEVTGGLTVTVTEGTANGNTVWTLTTDDPIVIGTTSLTFAQVGGGGAAYTAGAGMALVGGAFLVNAGNGLIADGSSTRVDPAIVVRKYAMDVGNGSLTTITVPHNLGTLDVQIEVYQKSNGETVGCDKFRTDTNNVSLVFAVAPASAAYRVVVQG